MSARSSATGSEQQQQQLALSVTAGGEEQPTAPPQVTAGITDEEKAVLSPTSTALSSVSVGGEAEQPMKEEKDLPIREVEEDDEENLLSEDAYSLLYTAEFCSRTALFAWFSIFLQGGMLLVTFLDLFDTGSEPSKCRK